MYGRERENVCDGGDDDEEVEADGDGCSTSKHSTIAIHHEKSNSIDYNKRQTSLPLQSTKTQPWNYHCARVPHPVSSTHTTHTMRCLCVFIRFFLLLSSSSSSAPLLISSLVPSSALPTPSLWPLFCFSSPLFTSLSLVHPTFNYSFARHNLFSPSPFVHSRYFTYSVHQHIKQGYPSTHARCLVQRPLT